MSRTSEPTPPTTRGTTRWSSPPPGSSAQRGDAFHVLLRWTEELDDARAITLWAGLSAVEDPMAREAALLRWIDWAGVAVPLGVKLRDLVTAVSTLTQELSATAQNPDRVYVYPVEDLAPLTRALHGWMRARESQPGVVLGVLQALTLARAALRGHAQRLRKLAPPPASGADFEITPDVPDREVISSIEVSRTLSDAPAGDPLGASSAMITSSVRRRVERGPVEEAVELLVTWLHAGEADDLPPWGASAVDFALLAGELQGVHFRPLAELASRAPSVWSQIVANVSQPRDALRAARLLSALASHPEVARDLSPSLADTAQEGLATLLAHPRLSVWSRAARALGRLAGHLAGAGQRLLALLQGHATPLMRLRATATLGILSPAAGSDLIAHRNAALRALELPVGLGETSAQESALVAALAVSIPDLCLDENPSWQIIARRVAARGGPEAWLAVLRAVQEIRLRDPSEQDAVSPIALDVRERADAWRGGSGVDAERVERAQALAGRIASADDRSPGALVADLVRAVSAAPSDANLSRHVEAFVAEMDVLVSNSARAVGSDNARMASQGGVVLEELVDVVVEGDLPVIAGRVADAAAHGAAVEAAEALRTRLMKMVWTGLRRPTPSAFAWRRWLVRAAGALPRSMPLGRRQAEVEREQVFETLERLADDPLFGQPVLLRYLGATLSELSQPLLLSLGAGAPLSVLVWLALRGALKPSHARLKRWMADEAPAESLDRLFDLMESSDQAHRDEARAVASLGALAGGDACRMGVVLSALGAECVDLAQRRPESHWSGLPRFDLTDLAGLADTLKRARDEAAFALSLEGERSVVALTAQAARDARAVETLSERAGRINRMLTTTSLKFLDAARRAEVSEHYLLELSSLAEAIASACGPLVEGGLRATLAKALVAVRAQANAAVREQKEGVRYIARLRVLGELSSAHEGGMTSTFLAEGSVSGKKLVVKLLRWEKFRGASAELARAMFEGEMERLAGVVHPNIVSIVDAGVVDEGAYLALEHIPGASLETLLRKLGRLDLRSLGPLVRDVARALAWLHGRKIIHRDIKPGNVIVQLDGPADAEINATTWPTIDVVRAVLIDFGVATELARIGSNEGVTGTPGYIAPEIARGLNLFGPAVDVYALGVLIFEMLTGSNPYLEGNPELNAVLVRHGSMAPPWQKLPPEAQAKPELVQLLAESTRIDPRLRPSMKDFLARWTRSLGLGA